MNLSQIDQEFDLLKQYMDYYIDFITTPWMKYHEPIQIKLPVPSSQASLSEMMDTYRRTGMLLINSNHDPLPEVIPISFEPMTFDRWKTNHDSRLCKCEEDHGVNADGQGYIYCLECLKIIPAAS